VNERTSRSKYSSCLETKHKDGKPYTLQLKLKRLLLASNSVFTGTTEMRAITPAAGAQVLTDSCAQEPISRNAIGRTGGYSKPNSPNKLLQY